MPNCSKLPFKAVAFSLGLLPAIVANASPQETEKPAEFHSAYRIYQLNNCGQQISQPRKSVSLFGDYNTQTQNSPMANISSWNHVGNGSITEWAGTHLTASAYAIPAAGNANNSCSQVDSLDVVLVKKAANWDHQHANGLEIDLAQKAVTFGQVESIIMDVKINSARTVVPSPAALIGTYKTFTAENIIQALDGGKVNLGITLYNTKDGPTLNAAGIIELDQSHYADQWLRVKIKLDGLRLYAEDHYVKTDKTPQELANTVISGLRLVAETRTGKVLRGSITSWNEKPAPETFKEQDLSIKKIELHMK